MLADLYIKNFKSIDMDNPIKLNEFSILCGSNSSGKSSLIQSILMLCQSFSSRYQDEPIILNGHLIRLGAFQDIKKHSSTEDKIHLSFSLPIKNSIYYRESERKVTCELVIGLRHKAKFKKEEEYHPLVLKNKVIISIKDDSGDYIDTDVVEIVLVEDNENSDVEYRVSLFESSEKKKINSEYPNFEIIGVPKGDLVPTNFIIEYDYLKKISSYIINFLINNNNERRFRTDETPPADMLILPKCFFEEIIKLIKNERKSIYDSLDVPEKLFENKSLFDNKKYKEMFKDENHFMSVLKENLVNSTFSLKTNDFPESFFELDFLNLKSWSEFLKKLESKKRKNLIELIDKNRTDLQDVWYKAMPPKIEREVYSSMLLYEVRNALSFYFARSVKYLGPLRNEPQAIYSSLGHLDPNTVGLKGEYTAAVLHKNRTAQIEYLSPSVVDDKLVLVSKKRPLRIACQEWLSYLGVIQEFDTADRGKLGYELTVKTHKDERWQDLTHVGVGVSQVLPIVLMFLLSESDDILIFEQPELHLHPKVQSRLCDLFLAMAESNRQCIIETHSEYLINRLRLRISQDVSELVQSKTSLYFIEKTNGTSQFTNVEINKYGSIINWPKDFFDQSDREVEKILYEASMKRKKERMMGIENASDN